MRSFLALEWLADEVDADLIVMSTAALAGPIRSVLGNVAGVVARRSLARCGWCVAPTAVYRRLTHIKVAGNTSVPR
jgi:hypothetical protein